LLALEELESFNPEYTLVSLGFDAHKDDPLSVFNVSLESYRFAFDKLNPYEPTYILEGGYNKNVLYAGVIELIEANKDRL